MKKLILSVLVLFFLIFPQKSFAEIIHSFDTQILAHKDGSMDITETINYDFEDEYHHGIYRYIPLYSKVGALYRIYEIKNASVLMDGRNEQFTTSKNGQQIYFKIGDPNSTITGTHIYKISYKVFNGIGSNFEDHDEIYWNMTGNDWTVPIENASGIISTDFYLNPTNVICFTGVLGSQEQNCTKGTNLVKTTSLGVSEGLTMVAVYPVGTFPKSILSSKSPDEINFFQFLRFYVIAWATLNILIAPILIVWYLRHKNKKRFGSPVVNFDIPKDGEGKILAPAIAGTIDTARLTREDITATLYDLAIRRYIKFKEDKTVRKMLPDSTKITIINLKKDNKLLSPFEKELLDFVFEDGDEIDISSLRTTFYKEFQNMEKSVFQFLVDSKLYAKNPKYQKGFFTLAGIAAFVTLNYLIGIVLFFLAIKLNGRTPIGDEIDFKIDGLKVFLKSMDRNYKWQVKNFYTVEQMIPYAIALGYINKFMENFKVNYPDYSPYWYVGFHGNFYSSYTSFNSVMTTTVAPTSSSGAGGGGFSGGGGGGGGGGSW